MFKSTTSKSGILLAIIILLFAFQSGLERIASIFSYIDELAGCIALLVVPLNYKLAKRKFKNRTIFFSICAFVFFILSGLIANFRYGYQPVSLVAIDVLTNSKFYLALISGYIMFVHTSWNTLRKYANETARAISTILFLIFSTDRFVHLYGDEMRYGIRSAILFYSHATYFAGALAFLLTILAVFYKKRNWVFMGMDIIMLCFTLRSKAIAAAAVYLFLCWYILLRRHKLRIWQLVLIAIMTFCVAWQQVYFYYIALAGKAARSIMTITSFKIMRDYFPLGTGFATYASHSAAENYSPVYLLYGFDKIYELSPSTGFLDDTFWPIIFGQTGFIGTIAYIFVLFILIRQCFRLKRTCRYLYFGSVFIIAYLLISSMAEPAFNNAVSVPLGFLLGIIFQKASAKETSYISIGKR